MNGKRTLLWVLVIVTLAAVAHALTNIVLTIPLPETKYTNLMTIASNRNETAESFLSNSVIREVEGQRLGMLIELWNAATPTQQENALQALKAAP